MAAGIVPFSSANVKAQAAKAWAEAKPVAESLPKPRDHSVARFFTTDECNVLIKEVLNEARQEISTVESIPLRQPLRMKTGGHVVFPGRTTTGQTFTMLIPLQVIGDVKLGEMFVDTDHCYKILTECVVEVSRGGKLVALIVSDIG
ncbi:hypothetical protein N7468_007969 [Penicillium chermesinum]|uniref:Uncharacterized protein n=1 Tax=Penicillium chermesinum TaxID=63820 RepID=A0A9W9THU6_9EURO|nr:uncharacterized protein N7468_007969 [Penicillium chermesinum]KAJ5223427.1 hypothetical protein N7468_007969 [Penicillium chermesinum]KAJ6155737.1 hypothetical protein N7470_006303 [Penicillium chermesinum]